MPLMPLTEARERALALARPGRVEVRPLADALGCFLAEPIAATRDLPGCDNSAMDGYAVRAEDTAGANRDRPAILKVVDTVYAGQRPARPVRRGEAARIFTGAPVPEGADAIVRQEATAKAATAGDVHIVVEAKPGDHIRRRGEEMQVGAPLFGAGQRIDAHVAGVFAALGLAEVRVYAPVRVSVVVVGDELLPPGAVAGPHQTYDSNRVMLSLLAREANAQVVHTARLPDDPAQLREGLREALERCEVLLTSGGASVGDRDHVKAVLRELGAGFAVDGVALKPGKPVAVAEVGGRVAVVLPGNPGAATVAFDQLARPLLLAMQGASARRRRLRVHLDTPRRKQAGLTYLLSAKLEQRGGALWAQVRPQGAGQQLQNVEMDGWVVLPPGRAGFAAGEQVEFEPIHGAAPVEPASGVRAVSIVGWSGAGKTTLIERLVGRFTERGHRVAVLKHTPHTHPLHKPGSDTGRFQEAGAVAVGFSTPEAAQLTFPSERPGAALDALLATTTADIVLVEGWKDGPLPKIVVRTASGDAPAGLSHVIAEVTGPPTADELSRLIEVLDHVEPR